MFNYITATFNWLNSTSIKESATTMHTENSEMPEPTELNPRHASKTNSITDISQSLLESCCYSPSLTANQLSLSIENFPIETLPAPSFQTAYQALADNIKQFEFEDRLFVYQNMGLLDHEITLLETEHEKGDLGDYQYYLRDFLECYASSIIERKSTQQSAVDPLLFSVCNNLGINLIVISDAQKIINPQPFKKQFIISGEEKSYTCFGNQLCDEIASFSKLYQKIDTQVEDKTKPKSELAPDYLITYPPQVSVVVNRIVSEANHLRRRLHDILINGRVGQDEPYAHFLNNFKSEIESCPQFKNANAIFEQRVAEVIDAAKRLFTLAELEVTKEIQQYPLAVLCLYRDNENQLGYATGNMNKLVESAEKQTYYKAGLMQCTRSEEHLKNKQTIEKMLVEISSLTKKTDKKDKINEFFPGISEPCKRHFMDNILNEADEAKKMASAYTMLFDRSWDDEAHNVKKLDEALNNHGLLKQSINTESLSELIFNSQSHATESDKPFSVLICEFKESNRQIPGIDKTADDITNAIRAIRAGKSNINTLVSSYPIDLLVQLCDKIKALFDITIRDAQLLSVLSMLSPCVGQKGRLAEIKTGEGKSLTTVMAAIILAKRGETVDIITSSKTLAARDAKEFNTLYAEFGLTSTCNCDDPDHYSERSKACYQGQQHAIVYGDAASFSGDTLRDEFFKFNTFNGRKATVALIDEVDSILLDRPSWLCQISEPIAGMSTCTPILYWIWNNTISEINKAKENGDIQQYFSNAKGIERLTVHIKNSLESEPNPFFRTNQTSTEDSYFIPKHLESFVQQRLTHWIKSAITAVRYSHNKEYNASEEKKTITPIDYANTGEWESDVQWQNGLHQFLQILNQFPVDSENLTSAFMSNYSLITRYHQVYGLSGTLGNNDEANCLQSLFDLSNIKIPTFRQSQFVERNGFIAIDDNIVDMKEKWLSFIYCDIMLDGNVEDYDESQTDVSLKDHKRERACLVVCKTIQDVLDITNGLEQRGIAAGDIVTYTKSDNAANITKVHAGKIIIATNLSGRGTDIDATEINEAGGLHVILSFLPVNDRVEKQAFGRTARKGCQGSGRLIIQQSELREHHIQTDPNTQEKQLMLSEGRALAEKSRLQSLVNHKTQLIQKGALFQDFQEYFHRLESTLKIDSTFQPLPDALRHCFIDLYKKYVLDEWAIFIDDMTNRNIIGDFQNFTQTINNNLDEIAQKNCFYAVQYANLLLDIQHPEARPAALKKAESLYDNAIQMGGLSAGFAAYNKVYVKLSNNKADISGAKECLHQAKNIFDKCITIELLMLCNQVKSEDQKEIPKTPIMKIIQTMLYSIEDQLKKIDELQGDYSELNIRFSDVMDLVEKNDRKADAATEVNKDSETVKIEKIPTEILQECIRLGLKGPLLISGKGNNSAAIILAITCALVAVAALAAMVITGGAAALLIGGVVFGAAVQGGINATKGAINGDFSLNQFGKEVAIGAATGLITAGVGTGLGVVAGRAVTHGMLMVRVAGHAAIGIGTGAVGGACGYMGNRIAYGGKWDAADAFESIGKGALGGVIGSVGGAFNRAGQTVIKQVAVGAIGDAAGNSTLQSIEVAQGKKTYFDGWNLLESVATSGVTSTGKQLAQTQAKKRIDLRQTNARREQAEQVRKQYVEKGLPENTFNQGFVRSDIHNENNIQFASSTVLNRRASLDGTLGTQGMPIDNKNRRWSNYPPSTDTKPTTDTRLAIRNTGNSVRQQAAPYAIPSRPSFLSIKSLTDGLTKAANEAGLGVNPKQTLQVQGISRNHRISYADIRDNVMKFCSNKNVAGLKDLFEKVLPFKETDKRLKNVTKAFDALKDAISNSKNESTDNLMNNFIGELNSCPSNLSLGNAVMNQSIGSHFDPNVRKNQDGSHSLTPITKGIVNNAQEYGVDINPPRIVNSILFSSHGEGRKVPIDSLTADSESLFKTFFPEPEYT